MMLALLLAEASAMFLDDALLEDMMPAPSARCMSGMTNATSTFNFPGPDPNSRWSAPYVGLEKHAFLAEMEHVDANTNRSWRVRIGQGGNPYSFVGPFGEAMPPQTHDLAPWIDEVWQTVAVDGQQNTDTAPYFIHQAGTYQREDTLKEKPFYSPNVARHCSKEKRTCTFASWGQQAHVPTEFTSPMMYYTRYTDCGEGVMELTWMMYNMGGAGGANTDSVSYLNVPWGGVRTSNLRDAVWERNGNEELLTPVAGWGTSGQIVRNLNTFGGYTAFAQALPHPAKHVSTPAGLVMVRAGRCSNSAHHTKQGKLTLKLQLKRTATVAAGTGDTFKLTNPKGEGMVVNGVLHWAWAGTSLFFYPKNQDPASATAECNRFFKNGDTMAIGMMAGSGKTKEDNLGLAFVHGSEEAGSFEGDVNWQQTRKPSRVRMGSTGTTRDYTVWTINSFITVPPGASYYYRQNIITDSFAVESEGLESRASSWVSEPSQRFLGNMAAVSSPTPGRALGIFDFAGSQFSVAAGDTAISAPVCGKAGSQLKCTGRSTPHGDAQPLFAINCGVQNYVGFDRYHFKQAEVEEEATKEGYALPSGLELRQRNCGVSASHSKSVLTLVMTVHQTAIVQTGTADKLKLIGANGAEMEIKNVMHWTWAGRFFFFRPKEQNRAAAVAQCKALGKAALSIVSLETTPAAPKEHKRPYVNCGTDSDGLPKYPSWKLLGFFELNACASLSTTAQFSAHQCDVAPTTAPTEAPTMDPMNPISSPTSSPTPKPTNPQMPVFNSNDPVFDTALFTVVAELGTATSLPTESPTSMPTTAGKIVAEKQKAAKAVEAVLPFALSISDAENPMIKAALTQGVATALGFPSSDVKITAINGVPVDIPRRLSSVESIDITFEIISQSSNPTDTQILESNVAEAATTGAIVANVQKAASEKGVLTQKLADMPRELPTPTVEIRDITVTELVEVDKSQTFENGSTRIVKAHGGNDVLLFEGSDFTSTCSHVKCSFNTEHTNVQVHHNSLEQHGNKHICKHGMHTEGKCGCECYDETAGLELID